MPNILECQAVTKAYGGLVACKDVSFAVQEQEIFAIVGPNGAGKTTLFDCISGLNTSTSGIVQLAGRQIQRMRPDQICQLGLTRTFQTTISFATQSVLTNVLVGSIFGQPGRGKPTLRFDTDAIEAALAALQMCDLLDKQGAEAGLLSVFERKRLMIATALATRPKLLLLDEPVGGLNRAEVDQIVALVMRINRSGVTILLIEHVMKAVQALANRMMVLHHGEKIAEGAPAAVLRDDRVIEVYLGGQGRALAARADGGGH